MGPSNHRPLRLLGGPDWLLPLGFGRRFGIGSLLCRGVGGNCPHFFVVVIRRKQKIIEESERSSNAIFSGVKSEISAMFFTQKMLPPQREKGEGEA